MTLFVLVILECSINQPFSLPISYDNTITKAIPSTHPAQEPIVKTWHHDCSNTSGLREEDILRAPFTPYGDWSDTEGIIESDGQSLYLANITEPTVPPYVNYYGPVQLYDLQDIFPVNGLRHFHTQMELENSIENVSAVAVALFDETLSPVLSTICWDGSVHQKRSFCAIQYYPRNFSILHNIFEWESHQYRISGSEDSLDYVNITWTASFSSELGITGYIPPWGTMNEVDDTIVTMDELEPRRAIKYVGIMIGGCRDNYEFPPISSSRIHDISLEYEIGGVVDISPPLLTPQLDQTYIVGQTGNTIEWKCADDYPYRFWLFERFQDLPLEEGLWNSSPISMSIDGLELGDYGFVLYIQDKAGFIVGDYVKVSVIDDPIINAFFSFVSANAQLILIISIVALGCVLDLRSRRRAARLRGDAWSRSLKKQTNNDNQSSDLNYE